MTKFLPAFNRGSLIYTAWARDCYLGSTPPSCRAAYQILNELSTAHDIPLFLYYFSKYMHSKVKLQYFTALEKAKIKLHYKLTIFLLTICLHSKHL